MPRCASRLTLSCATDPATNQHAVVLPKRATEILQHVTVTAHLTAAGRIRHIDLKRLQGARRESVLRPCRSERGRRDVPPGPSRARHAVRQRVVFTELHDLRAGRSHPPAGRAGKIARHPFEVVRREDNAASGRCDQIVEAGAPFESTVLGADQRVGEQTFCVSSEPVSGRLPCGRT